MSKFFKIYMAAASIFLFTDKTVGSEKSTPVQQEATYKQGLTEFLKVVPESYAQYINRAILAIAPGADMDSMRFEPLLGGLSNAKLFKFSIGKKRFVFRFLDKEPAAKKAELEAHKTAVLLDIAPKIIYVDSNENPSVIVMEFIDGRMFSTADLNNKKLLKKVMATIKKFNNYKGSATFEKESKIDKYHNIYKKNIEELKVVYPSGFDQAFEELRADYEKFNRQRVPIHGDLNPWNILITKDEKVYLVDWPNTRMDNPYVDIGSLSYLAGATPEQTKNILRAYLSRNPKKSEIREALFFQSVEIFLFSIQLIRMQKERSRQKLDIVLNAPDLQNFSVYQKEGVKDKIKTMQGLELTKVALSLFKEFNEIKKLYKKES